MATRFRITTWPGNRLPLPPTVRVRSELDPIGKVIVPCLEEVDGDKWLLGREFKPSGQTYLRLLEVDLEDPEAILGFVNTFGILDAAWAHWSGLRELGEYDRELNQRREWRAITKSLVATLTGNPDDAAPRELDNYELRFIPTADELRARTLTGQIPNVWHYLPFIETLEEFRFGARVFHDVYWAWRVFSEGRDPAEVEWKSPTGFETLGLSSRLLTMVLPRLGRIGPQLQISAPDWPRSAGPWQPPHTATVEPHSAPPTARLYQACAIELYNHIVEQATYRVCANENCARTFVEQEGRAHHGQHRKKGVKFCSAGCARSQAQRNYRRRQRSASSTGARAPCTQGANKA